MMIAKKFSSIAILFAALILGYVGIAHAGSTVSEIRHWSGPDYTRIVIDVDGSVEYIVNRLKSPDRVYMDFNGSRLGLGKKFTTVVNDGRIGLIRSSQYNNDTVRVVMDMRQDIGFKVFSLKNPTRIVVDIFRKKSSTVPNVMTVHKNPVKQSKPVVVARPTSPTRLVQAGRSAPLVKRAPAKAVVGKKPAVVKKATARAPVVASSRPVPVRSAKSRARRTPARAKDFKAKRVVVIDPGHGGKDPGAIANGLREKHLVLDIAKRIKRELERKGGYEVILTRSTDKFLELEERAMVANRHNADIFVSVHVNASRNRRVSGLETYILSMDDEESSLKVAARENMVSEREMRKKRDEVGAILASMTLNRDTFKARELAGKVQKSMVTSLRKHYSGVNDHKDRGAMFYVLYRAHAPSILVEASYLTNRSEAARLRSATYRSRIASGIATGIAQYFKESPSILKIAMR